MAEPSSLAEQTAAEREEALNRMLTRLALADDARLRANAQQPKLFVGMILILILAEALALYSGTASS